MKKIQSPGGLLEQINKKNESPIRDNYVKELIQEFDLRIEYILRNCVKPVIKGEITKGKIKWRGIKLVSLPTVIKYEYDEKGIPTKVYVNMEQMVTQRGVPVEYNELQFQVWKSWKKVEESMWMGRSSRFKYCNGDKL